MRLQYRIVTILRGGRQYALLLGLLLLWEAIPHIPGIGGALIPHPTGILKDFVLFLLDGTLIRHAANSLLRVSVGVVCAILAGILMGSIAGIANSLGRGLEAFMRLLKPIPPVAWIPISILWFHVTDSQQVFIIFIGTVFVVFFATMDGFRGVPLRLRRVARSLGASKWTIVTSVLLRGALPDILRGVREAVAFAWFIIVAAEFVSAPNGLGYLILEGRNIIEPSRVFVGAAAIGLISWGLDHLFVLVERSILRWQNV